MYKVFVLLIKIYSILKKVLSKGKLEGKVVTCQRHGSQFDVKTGTCIGGPKIGFIKLKAKDEITYEVKVEDKSIKVNT